MARFGTIVISILALFLVGMTACSGGYSGCGTSTKWGYQTLPGDWAFTNSFGCAVLVDANGRPVLDPAAVETLPFGQASSGAPANAIFYRDVPDDAEPIAAWLRANRQAIVCVHLNLAQLGEPAIVEALAELPSPSLSIRLDRPPTASLDFASLKHLSNLNSLGEKSIFVDTNSSYANSLIVSLSQNTNITGLSIGALEFNKSLIDELGSGAVRALAGMKSLRYLYVSNLFVGEEFLRVVGSLPDLHSLTLPSYIPFPGEGLRHLRTSGSLRSLTATHLHLGRSATREIMKLPYLEQLDLTGNRVDPGMMQDIAGCPLLRCLDLSRTELTDESLALLAPQTELRQLFLSGNPVTNAGIAALAPHLRKLETLDISGTRITSAVVRALEPMKELRDLNLSVSDVDDEALAYLAANGSRLESLTVNKTKITPAGLAALARLKHLKSVSVFNTEIGEGDGAVLKEKGVQILGSWN
ncbi:MAG: hypothetical protein P9L99_07125 [Candidatus Lernaella stagnicola]|nr:hypothetical protein [Candidatus Lernaella stagnicola]